MKLDYRILTKIPRFKRNLGSTFEWNSLEMIGTLPQDIRGATLIMDASSSSPSNLFSFTFLVLIWTGRLCLLRKTVISEHLEGRTDIAAENSISSMNPAAKQINSTRGTYHTLAPPLLGDICCQVVLKISTYLDLNPWKVFTLNTQSGNCAHFKLCQI